MNPGTFGIVQSRKATAKWLLFMTAGGETFGTIVRMAKKIKHRHFSPDKATLIHLTEAMNPRFKHKSLHQRKNGSLKKGLHVVVDHWKLKENGTAPSRERLSSSKSNVLVLEDSKKKKEGNGRDEERDEVAYCPVKKEHLDQEDGEGDGKDDDEAESETLGHAFARSIQVQLEKTDDDPHGRFCLPGNV